MKHQDIGANVEEEEIEFVDIDTAISACENISRAQTMIRDIKASLFDITVIGSAKEAVLEIGEMKDVSYWVRTYNIALDVAQTCLITDIEEQLINTTVGVPVEEIVLKEAELTTLWELCEKIIEVVV